MKSIASRFLLVLLSICLIAGIIFGIYLFTKDDETTEVSYAAKVLGTISDKLEEVSNTFAEMATESSDEGTGIDSVSAMAIDFEESDASSYLTLNYYVARVVYAASYLAENTNTANGYANGFEFDKVYTGNGQIGGYEGTVAILSETTDDGVYLYFDLIYEVSGMGEVTEMVTLYTDYDFENYACNSIKVNYKMVSPYVYGIFAVEYDFVNNSFEGFYAVGSLSSEDDINEIITSYNDGSLTSENAFSLDLSTVIIVSGNITTDVNDLSYTAYYGSPYASSLIDNSTVEETYDNIYSSLYTFNFRSDLIDTSSATVVSFISDCVNYGWNKATYISATVGDNRTYYLFTFIEYEDLIEYLTEIQTTIYADDTANNNVKELIDASISFLQSQGKASYIGTFDEIYNDISISFENNSYGVLNVDGSSKPAPIYQLKDSSTGAYVEFAIYNGNVRNLNYGS